MQNDIIGIYDSSNNLVARYEYDAWGNHKVYDQNGNLNTTSYFIGNVNPFRYRSYYYDRETNLYYCYSRYYNPDLCRWMSLDSLEYLEHETLNGMNLYAYCNNDPVNCYDPNGNLPILLLLFGALVVTGIIVTEPTDEVPEGKLKSDAKFGDVSFSGPEINHQELTFISLNGSLAEKKIYFDGYEDINFYMTSFSGNIGLAYNRKENKVKVGPGFSFFSFGVNVGRFHISLNFGTGDILQWGT